MAATCTVPGLPSAITIRRWRVADPEFASTFDFVQHEGWIGLAELVTQEVEQNLERHGIDHAR